MDDLEGWLAAGINKNKIKSGTNKCFAAQNRFYEGGDLISRRSPWQQNVLGHGASTPSFFGMTRNFKN